MWSEDNLDIIITDEDTTVWDYLKYKQLWKMWASVKVIYY